MAVIWRVVVAVTDGDWFRQLAAQTNVDEVNFWLPGGGNVADPVGTPWLFKLHSPNNYIVGGGFLNYYAKLPVGVAWDTFGLKNGADSFEEMLSRVSKYRRASSGHYDDIGCVILGEPFFLSRADWIDVPADWSPHTQQRKHYDVSSSLGADLWARVMLRLRGLPVVSPVVKTEGPAFGKPIIVEPRLGQGSFRVAVLDAYQRRCAITAERTLPALDAAHIRPFAQAKSHEIANGLALRSDLHRLYDQGFISVRPDYSLAVSHEIKDRFENGRDYYAMADRRLRLPENPAHRPDLAALDWHYSERFRR